MTDPIENTPVIETPTTPVLGKTPQEKRKRLILAAVIVVLALLLLGFIATRSLPGGMLYGLKTNVIEALNESVQVNQEAKAAYQVQRMEERLEELKALAEKDTISPASIADLRDMVTRHTQTLKAAAELGNEEIPTEAMLGTISDFGSVAFAMETISEREEPLQELGEHIEDVRREAVNLHQDLVDRYVERESQENIFEFVRALLGEVSNELTNAGISEETIDDAEVYINRVGAAMAEGDYPRAITAIAEAKRFIMIEKYGALETEEAVPTDTNTSTSTDTDTSATTTEQEETQTAPVTESARGSFGFSN